MGSGRFYNLLYRFELPSAKLKLHIFEIDPHFFKELFQGDMKILFLLYMSGLTANESTQSFSFA